MHVHDEDGPARVLRLREGEQVAEVEASIIVRAGKIGPRVVVRHSCSSFSAILHRHNAGIRLAKFRQRPLESPEAEKIRFTLAVVVFFMTELMVKR
jgi:hypothetical protein